MAKRRYNAKKIAQTPSLKRKMAEIAVQFGERSPELSLVTILTYGHRGHISYSEDELCKIFDKIFTKALADAAEKRVKLEELIKTAHNWQRESHKKELDVIEEHISKLQAIANEIFEEKFL